MVFAYLGISRTQAAIAKTLGLNPPFGTRHSNITKLASARIKVTYEAGDLAKLRHWIEQGTPSLSLYSLVICRIGPGNTSNMRWLWWAPLPKRPI
jgi:hypothetical protein